MAKLFKIIEEKKEDFRAYLDKNDVIFHLTQALVSLYEEKNRPENPIEYIRKKLPSQQEKDGVIIQSQEGEELKMINEEYKKKIAQLKNDINEQNNELERYKN